MHAFATVMGLLIAPIGVLWKWTYKLFDYLTGKDGLAFAQTLFFLSFPLKAVGLWREEVTGTSWFFFFIIVAFAYWCLTIYAKDCQKQDYPSSGISLHRETFTALLYVVLETFIALLCLLTTQFLDATAAVLQGVFWFSLCVYQGGSGRTVFSKVKDKLSESSKVLTPSPVRN